MNIHVFLASLDFRLTLLIDMTDLSVTGVQTAQKARFPHPASSAAPVCACWLVYMPDQPGMLNPDRIDAEHLKPPGPERMKASVHGCERGTFLSGSDAGFRLGAGPPVGQVRLHHTGLSAIPLCVFLYLLQGQRRGGGDQRELYHTFAPFQGS